jgi:hypothetical protein
VVHRLPLFHVHGLVLGVLGPVRLGGTARHLDKFSPEGVTSALAEGASMLFGVPTMYRRLAAATEGSPEVASALAAARLLVSGSAPLPASEHRRFEAMTGQRIVERYGMTETLMNTAVTCEGPADAGYVGRPLREVELRLVDDAGAPIRGSDDETIGEMEVRGPNLFLGYLNRPDATAKVMHDGWFRTGDLATRRADGYVRIVGRRATDLIKTGGFKVGAGEVEAALREHPAVDDAAVVGEPDEDLGERIVAWVVLREGRQATSARRGSCPPPRRRPPAPPTTATHAAGTTPPVRTSTRLLWNLRTAPGLRAFTDARLAPVFAHDRRHTAKLLPTLEALCAHGGRKASPARALGLERPSLYHRINRLEHLARRPALRPGHAARDPHRAPCQAAPRRRGLAGLPGRTSRARQTRIVSTTAVRLSPRRTRT